MPFIIYNFLLGLSGNTYLDWMAIANVLPQHFPSTDFVFMYRGQENESTVWQGKNPIDNLLKLYTSTPRYRQLSSRRDVRTDLIQAFNPLNNNTTML